MKNIENLLRDSRIDKSSFKYIYYIYKEKAPDIYEKIASGEYGMTFGSLFVLVDGEDVKILTGAGKLESAQTDGVFGSQFEV